MQIGSTTETVIVPFIHAEASKIRALQKSLNERKALREFLNTPQFAYLSSIDLALYASTREIPNLDARGELGSLIVSVKTSGSSLNESQVPEMTRRFIDWVKLMLMKNQVAEWIPHIYSVLTISKTDPSNVKNDLKSNKKLLASLVFVAVPPDSHFTDEAIEKVSKQTDYLETDFYCFSPYGALIYDQNFARSQKYIETQVIPRIADFRTMQAFLDTLSRSLNEKISSKRPIKISNDAFQEIASLRETSLKALSSIEYDKRLTHLADVSEKLSNIFGLEMLQTSIEHKVEALNSITQALGDLRAQKIQDRLSWANLLLAIIAIFLAILALPPILGFISGR